MISLSEQNKACNLFSAENTSFINPYSFGSSPIADDCSNIELNCIFDEISDDNPQNLRWFENGGQEQNFWISKEPQDVDFLDQNSALNDDEVLTFVYLVNHFTISWCLLQ